MVLGISDTFNKNCLGLVVDGSFKSSRGYFGYEIDGDTIFFESN